MLTCNFTFLSFDVWLKISICLTHLYSHQHSISNSGLSLGIRQFVETWRLTSRSIGFALKSGKTLSRTVFSGIRKRLV